MCYERRRAFFGENIIGRRPVYCQKLINGPGRGYDALSPALTWAPFANSTLATSGLFFPAV